MARPGSSLDRLARVAPAAAVVISALGVFSSALLNQFVNWDDAPNFLANPHYRGLGWEQLVWMLTTFHMGPYAPLTWLTLGADYALWGMDPRGYHLTSLLLHAVTALVFYFLSLRLLRLALPRGQADMDLRVGAMAAALFFAVHPLRAESVTWVTERRDVLSGLFYVATIIAYLKAVGPTGHRRGWYWGSVGLFAAAVLSKSIVVTLPVVLLVLDVYPLGRLGGARGWRDRRVWAEKAPLVAIAAAGAVAAFIGVLRLGNLRSLHDTGLTVRLILAAYGIAFYLFKTIVPLGLSPLYQLPLEITWLHFATAIGGTLLAVLLRERSPAFTAAWTVYVVTLLPVLGILQNGPQAVADRYSYLACLPWAVLVGAATARRFKGSTVVRLVVALWLVALAVLSWQQAQVWRDSITLWKHVLAAGTANRAAHSNLADAYWEAGRRPEALLHYQQAMALSSSKAPWLARIGQKYEEAGDDREAERYFSEALRLQPGLPAACGGLARIRRKGTTHLPADADGCS